ncbi:MAG: hypothetical protein KatS3mg010_0265 [Acidimicrobiia bacterium]|nr:MAG: hypothetical protein KatS3mg010_0265 [Acidimicrobiia bacterium]
MLAVLVYHYFELGQAGGLGGAMENWMPGGFMGVEVFFVISGYLITPRCCWPNDAAPARVSFASFWLRRARRLLPALLVMLAVVVCYALLFLPDAIDDLKRDVVGALTYTSNWWQIDLPYAAQEGRPPLLRHLWSLAIEEQFYLFWPLVLVGGLRRFGRRRMLGAIVAAAIASAALMAVVRGDGLGVTDPSAAYFSTITRLSGLLLGSALAFVWVPYRIRGTPGRGARTVLDVAGVTGLVVLWHAFRNWHFEDPSTFRGGFLIVDVATLLVIAATVHHSSDLGRLLGLRPLVWIGQRSYGIYLWHYPIFAITRPNLDNTWWPPVVVFVRFGLTLLIAALSYKYVEVPIRQGAIGRYVARVRSAHGGRRRRLALGGIGVALTVSLVGVSLGTTLAGADSPDDDGGGNAAAGEEGDELDPDALATLCATADRTNAALEELCADVVPASARTTATTSARSPGSSATPTTKAAAATPTTPAPTTTAPPGVVVPIGIGDSVMAGASGALQRAMPGMIVDAIKSRQFAEAISVLERYRDLGALPAVVVIHLGTNGRFGDGEFDHLMSVVGPDRQVYFLTARMPRSWEAEVNATLARGVQRHANAQLLDWRQYAGCHADWFGTDGFHLTSAGRTAYAEFVRVHVRDGGAGLQYCP